MEGCSLTQKDIDDNARKETLWLAKNEQLKCASGDRAHCAADTVEVVTFVGVGLATVGIAPELPALVEAFGWQLLSLCSQSSVCWSVVGGGTQLLTENNEANPIGATGDIGEQYLRRAGGQSQYYFPTTQGGRYIDQLVNGNAYESKVGYVSLTPEISVQVAKDVELLTTGEVKSVSWIFFPSPVTGAFGPSRPLYDLLYQNGISIYFVIP